MEDSRAFLNALVGVGIVVAIYRLASFVSRAWRARSRVNRLQKLGKVSI